MKFGKIFGDVACVVGCCVGVGFLSGKEAQVFFGNVWNVLLFAAVFFLCTYVTREFCRKTASDSVEKLSGNLFKRRELCNAAIAFCSFVCLTTSLAGVQALSQYVFPSRLPYFSFAAALCAAFTARSLNALKKVNVISLLLAAALLVALCFTPHGSAPTAPPVYRPVSYALFSVAMSLGITSRLACDCTQKQNALCSALSAALIALLLLLVLPLCGGADLPVMENLHGAFKIFATVTLLISAVTGLAANSLPVTELLKSILPDETLCNALTFGAALLFSMFGFDFAVKWGYALVAVAGGLLVIKMCSRLWVRAKA